MLTHPPTSRLLPALAAVLGTLTGSARLPAADRTGEQVYKATCARCHGADGRGTKDYPDPLAGDKSVAQLAKLIARTMPEDDPGTCTGKDAEAVAAYIHGAFYSPVARDRNRPARVELARLTVNQYRNAVSDVVAAFRPAADAPDDRRGLTAEYYKARRFTRQNRVLERLDPQVNFDFGRESPVPGKIEPHEFSVRWSGSIVAPDTGVYEFVVRTEHAARLWVNDAEKPLIDAWVKSGNDSEYKSALFLLGGRAYPLRLEFSKAKQGVDDSRKKGAKPPPSPPASVVLAWKPPQGVVEPVSARFLSPGRAAERYVVSTPFPPDDRSYGWERGTTVSKAWDAATTDAAIDAAGYVAAHLDELAGTRVGGRGDAGFTSGNPSDINLDAGVKLAADRPAKLREFARRFAERAFRRPLTDEQARLYIDRQFESLNDPEVAVKRAVLLVLKSPRFLYREVGGGADGYDAAARLSFALWDSIPDRELLAAAAKGELAAKGQVARQAERMLADPRAKAKLRRFFHHWLKVEDAAEVAKDPARFPGFDAVAVADLRASLDLFVDDIVWGDNPDFRRLLLSEDVYLNGRLARLYGRELPADAPFRPTALDPGKRAGVLTHPYLMAAFSYPADTSPIHRGVFVARGVLGVVLRPPPEAVSPLAPSLHPGLTTRERVILQTKPAACMTCHGVINPLGFTFENFDPIGRYREKDGGKAADPTGSYQTRGGETKSFHGPRELATFLAGSEEVHTAFVEQMFHHLVQQPVRAYGPRRLEELRQSFAATGYDIRKLAVEIAAGAAVAGRSDKPAGP